MGRILGVEHWDSRFDYNNAGFFARRGDVSEFARLYAGEEAPDPRLYDLVIVYGGYMNAYDDAASPWLAKELKFLEACLRTATPVLGICLGSQLLARALGARVYRSERPEFGFKRLTLNAAGREDPVLGALGDAAGSFLGLQWHDDAWDLPTGAALLASSAAWPNQAFRYGPDALGIQFHLEFTQPHMAWAVARPDEPPSEDPEGEDMEAFAAPGPRYDELRDNMEIVLGRILDHGKEGYRSPGGLVISSSSER